MILHNLTDYKGERLIMEQYRQKSGHFPKALAVIFLSLVLWFTLPMPSAVFAADSDFQIENGVLIRYLGKGGNVTIPGSVTVIGEYAFNECTSLTGITIPGSVTEIGAGAFYKCTSLTGVIIPDSVTGIAGETFSGCTGLTGVTIPGSVTEIGGSAFKGCTSLTGVTIPNSVTEIREYAFVNCSSLTNVTIPNSVTEIGRSAFQGCTSLTGITIPNSVTKIWEAVFNDSGIPQEQIDEIYAQVKKNKQNFPPKMVDSDGDKQASASASADRDNSNPMPFIVVLILLVGVGAVFFIIQSKKKQTAPTTIVKLRCPSCNELCDEKAAFCPACGKKIK